MYTYAHISIHITWLSRGYMFRKAPNSSSWLEQTSVMVVSPPFGWGMWGNFTNPHGQIHYPAGEYLLGRHALTPRGLAILRMLLVD